MLRARCGIAATGALVALLAAPSPGRLISLARADALPDDYEPPVCSPVACPDGSTLGGGGHGSCPSSCLPIGVECAPDGSCSPGARCLPTRFCLDMRGIGRVVASVVVGECAEGGSCVEGTCHEVSRCVTIPPGTGGPSMPGAREGPGASSAGAAASPTATPTPPSGGMCSMARSSSAAPFALVIATLAVACSLARARRRRHRR